MSALSEWRHRFIDAIDKNDKQALMDSMPFKDATAHDAYDSLEVLRKRVEEMMWDVFKDIQ